MGSPSKLITAAADEGRWVAKKLTKSDGAEALDARIGEIERKLDRLRGLYESFFIGVERAPPNVPRREMNRLILELQQEPISNSSLRFRFQTIQQRWVLFTAYWNRTLREIEMGTFRRDLARAQRHLADKGGVISEQEAIALGIPAPRAKAFAERQQRLAAARAGNAPAQPAAAPAATAAGPDAAAPAATATANRPAAGPAASKAPAPRAAAEPAIPGVTDADISALYRRYVDTHRKTGDPKPPLTLDKIRERLRTQIPKVLAERNCRRVTLEVAVEGGKVRLRAWPVVE
jgi:hypothetical protein